MFIKTICYVSFVLFSVCNSAFVDTLLKCSYKDSKCVADLAQNALKDISKNGVQELNIPPIDPLHLNDLSIPMLGLLNITMKNVQIKGIKDCEINSIDNNMEKGVSNMDITCDINIKGNFKVEDISPLVENFLGKNTIHADGNMKAKLEKLHMKMIFFYHVIKKDDGDIYIKCHLDEFLYNFDIGNMRMVANKIFFGNQDISDFIVSFINQNWKFFMPSFGKSIFDVSMEIFKDILHRFFEPVPAKFFLIDDLSTFVKN